MNGSPKNNNSVNTFPHAISKTSCSLWSTGGKKIEECTGLSIEIQKAK